MTTENDFLLFANSATNIDSQATYAALAAITAGFPSGILASVDLNKVLRQATTGMALLGAFMQAQSQAAVDNGNLTTLLTNFEAALTSYVASLTSTPGATAYATPGTFTYTPPNNCIVEIELWGGGGGGGGSYQASYSGTGGCGGGYSKGIFSLTGGTGYTIVVGAGGTVGAGYPTISNGGTGGTSSFNSSMIFATGGMGGNAAGSGGFPTLPTTRGYGSGGFIDITGGFAGSGYQVVGSNCAGGSGGCSYGSSITSPSVGSIGLPGVFPGGGGGGGSGAYAGGAGASGVVNVTVLR